MDVVEGKTSVKRAAKRAAATSAKKNKLMEGQLKKEKDQFLRNQLLESVGHPSQKRYLRNPQNEKLIVLEILLTKMPIPKAAHHSRLDNFNRPEVLVTIDNS